VFQRRACTGRKTTSKIAPITHATRSPRGEIHPATAPAITEVTAAIASRAAIIPIVKVIFGSAAAYPARADP
jgi:hypothetical protein